MLHLLSHPITSALLGSAMKESTSCLICSTVPALSLFVSSVNYYLPFDSAGQCFHVLNLTDVRLYFTGSSDHTDRMHTLQSSYSACVVMKHKPSQASVSFPKVLTQFSTEFGIWGACTMHKI
jgi:hypothetical protein